MLETNKNYGKSCTEEVICDDYYNRNFHFSFRVEKTEKLGINSIPEYNLDLKTVPSRDGFSSGYYSFDLKQENGMLMFVTKGDGTGYGVSYG